VCGIVPGYLGLLDGDVDDLVDPIDVTHGEDVRLVGAHLGVHGDAVVTDLDLGLVQVEARRVWSPPEGLKKVVILNGHGGNPDTICATLREIAGMDDMPFVCSTGGITPEGWQSPIEHASDHGGEDETSRMMWIRPDLVREDSLADNPIGRLAVPMLAETNLVRPWHLYVPASAGGETRTSSADKGRGVIEAGAAGLADLLVELSTTPWSERFPYA